MGLWQLRHRTGSRFGLRDVTRTYDNGSFGILLHFIRICHTSRCSSLTATISWSLNMTVLTVCSIDLIIGYHLYDNGSSRSKIIKVFILILRSNRQKIRLWTVIVVPASGYTSGIKRVVVDHVPAMRYNCRSLRAGTSVSMRAITTVRWKVYQSWTS